MYALWMPDCLKSKNMKILERIINGLIESDFENCKIYVKEINQRFFASISSYGASKLLSEKLYFNQDFINQTGRSLSSFKITDSSLERNAEFYFSYAMNKKIAENIINKHPGLITNFSQDKSHQMLKNYLKSSEFQTIAGCDIDQPYGLMSHAISYVNELSKENTTGIN